MRNATVKQYNQATSTSGADRRIMVGPRYTTVIWTYYGREIASKTETLKRGKVSNVIYSVDPDFLPK